MKKGVVKKYLILLSCIVLTGCSSSNVSQDDLSKVIKERDELRERVDYLESVLADKSGDVESEDTTQTVGEQTTAEKDASESSEKQENAVEVLAEYTLDDGIGWYTRHFMIVKNNSDKTVDISTSSLAYSKDGTMLGAGDSSFKALGAGCVSVIYEAFEVDGEIGYYETELTSTQGKYYESVIQDLSYVQNDIESGAVFQVTNNGEDAAAFVEGYALFFLGDELVGYDSTYFTDDDSEIKSGKTISKQMVSYNSFDRIEFYLTGRK